jgi:hypothetical protein
MGSMNDWISVTDGLPEPNVGVLVVLKGMWLTQCLAYVVASNRIGIDLPNSGPWRVLWLDADNRPREYVRGDITHWMRLPPLPAGS